MGTNQKDENIIGLITSVVQSPFYDPSLDKLAIKNDMLKVLPVLRRIRACYSQPAKIFTGCMASPRRSWSLTFKPFDDFNKQTLASEIGLKSLSEILIEGAFREKLLAFSAQLESTSPHTLFPTSSYRESTGSVISL